MNVVSDAAGMKNISRKYMEKLLNVENDWDGEVDCPGLMGPCCLISEEEVEAAIKGLKIGKAASPTGVVGEMMKASGGFGTMWMIITDQQHYQRRLYSRLLEKEYPGSCVQREM